MFLKNKNVIFKNRRSKVTDYAALRDDCLNCQKYMIMIIKAMSQEIRKSDFIACADH